MTTILYIIIPMIIGAIILALFSKILEYIVMKQEKRMWEETTEKALKKIQENEP